MREFFAPLRAGLLTVLVSDVDYERVKKHKWRGDDTGASGKPYIKTDLKLDDGRRTSLYLHRFITGCPPAYRADHRDIGGGHLGLAGHRDRHLAGRADGGLHGDPAHPGRRRDGPDRTARLVGRRAGGAARFARPVVERRPHWRLRDLALYIFSQVSA